LYDTYLNPVHSRPFPDPFVLKYCGEYWGYATGFWDDGRCFGILRSRDLVRWSEVGSAMEPLPGGATCYWAPEVSYDNGRFLMYYSVGDEEHMQIRVAVAEHPGGPFIDTGRRLTTEEFAIDPHVFTDDDGKRYLFYATDFLTHSHIGTGTVFDLMLDSFTLAHRPRLGTRARFDWQVYDPRRLEKGGVRWHTVEGPFVLKRKRLYYQMFSGGNWKNPTYGVSYAVTDNLDASGEWEQASDGVIVLPILRTRPGLVVGPGHNSAVRGPDNRQLFCIYHRWATDGGGRLLSIDPLDWAGQRLLVLGPSVTPQPAPLGPALVDFFEEERGDGLGQHWNCSPGSRWAAVSGAAVEQSRTALAEACCKIGASCFVTELSLRALESNADGGGYGVSICSERGSILRVMILPGAGHIAIYNPEEMNEVGQEFDLPHGFDPKVYHLLRLEVDGRLVRVEIDEGQWRWGGRLSAEAGAVALITRRMAAAFAGFALTVGWQDLFTGPEAGQTTVCATLPEGWEVNHGEWSLKDQQLWQTDEEAARALIIKGPLLVSYELVINARLVGEGADGGCYGVYPALRDHDRGPLLTVERNLADRNQWVLRVQTNSGVRDFPLPATFDPMVDQQFRFRKQEGRLHVMWESVKLSEIECPLEATQIGLYSHRAAAAFEMVRVTAILQ
jgi:arabinan endo-1,5-alpha-L-arabinosidase